MTNSIRQSVSRSVMAASALSVLTMLGSPSAAQQASQTAPRPAVLERLLACRALADSGARLTCFDAEAATLDDAERQGEVVVVDRAQVGQARRQLFGFELPSMPGLFDRGENPEQVDAIETTLVRASARREGEWIFTLADGSIWRQVNMEATRFPNRAGEAVRVRRAAMGSYLLTVGNGRAVRVRRVNP